MRAQQFARHQAIVTELTRLSRAYPHAVDSGATDLPASDGTPGALVSSAALAWACARFAEAYGTSVERAYKGCREQLFARRSPSYVISSPEASRAAIKDELRQSAAARNNLAASKRPRAVG